MVTLAKNTEQNSILTKDLSQNIYNSRVTHTNNFADSSIFLIELHKLNNANIVLGSDFFTEVNIISLSSFKN